MTPRSTFEQCSSFYDALTAHHDYEDWMSSLEGLARRHGLQGRRVLDIACGTGKSFLPMLARGYEVTACDGSESMLRHAQAKADGRARLFVADMRELDRVGEFDLITCIDEPLNYLLDEADLAHAFQSVRPNLAPGGIYLFDLNTVATYRSIFASDDCWESGGWFFVWRGASASSVDVGDRAESTIEAFREEPDGRWHRISNPHVQRHFPETVVRGLLARAGLRCLGIYGQFRDGRIEPESDEYSHTKLIYVCAPDQ